ITQLARAIGVDAIAEGVETIDQARQLRRLGCAAAQGWLWGKATPVGKFSGLPHRFPAPTVAPSTRWARRRPEADVREEHGLVRMMELQGEGASLSTIAAALNGEGFRTPSGQRWHRLTVARALRDVMPDAIAG
ncbi:MAG: EAL domain-containing protein, partial [Frankiales bacterium]|nr:EAL domain-containing protein [Frankiales bacterium]